MDTFRAFFLVKFASHFSFIEWKLLVGLIMLYFFAENLAKNWLQINYF